jgi:hypothetical protein
MIIDTHKAIEKLLAVGNTKESSEAIVSIINSQEDNVSTKADILAVRTDLEKLELKIEVEFKWMRILMLSVLGLLIKIAFFN